MTIAADNLITAADILAEHSSAGAHTTDVINEKTGAAGVTVDSVKLKDGGFVCADGSTGEVDTINEATVNAGVTTDGVLHKDGGVVLADGATLEADIVNEATAAAGVTIDGVLLKDSSVAVAAIAHAMLDGSVHSDSVADGVTRGSIIYGNATPKWDELVVGGAGTVLTSDGTDASWAASAAGGAEYGRSWMGF